MQHARLSRKPHHPEQGQTFLGRLTLARARLHEVCGPARHTLAMIIAGAMQGPVFWVAPNWAAARPYGPGMVSFADPGRFVFAHAARAEDILWTLEEVMRAGTVPLVIGDLPSAPGLTPVRRLHLAGETGAREGRHAPIGLILTPEGAAAGVESRWFMAPDHGPESTRWQLSRKRARSAPEQTWQVRPHGDSFALAPAKSQQKKP
ncbi:MAG: hypothetical protein GY945_01855 [Rhodobacteraceae bacterium]|nr:hypothetical protein [Paracoccaceae bacterium]